MHFFSWKTLYQSFEELATFADGSHHRRSASCLRSRMGNQLLSHLTQHFFPLARRKKIARSARSCPSTKFRRPPKFSTSANPWVEAPPKSLNLGLSVPDFLICELFPDRTVERFERESWDFWGKIGWGGKKNASSRRCPQVFSHLIVTFIEFREAWVELRELRLMDQVNVKMTEWVWQKKGICHLKRPAGEIPPILFEEGKVRPLVP